MQHVPIDNHVHVGVLGVRHPVVNEVAELGAVAVGAPTAVFIGVEREACEVGAPSSNLFEALGIHVVGEPR